MSPVAADVGLAQAREREAVVDAPVGRDGLAQACSVCDGAAASSRHDHLDVLVDGDLGGLRDEVLALPTVDDREGQGDSG